MKRTALMLTAAIFLTSAMPALAEPPQSKEQRDECLLASKNCMTQVDDIYKRMQKLNKEIKKGTKVYSPEELKKLQQKLTETQELLRSIELHGGN
ncbi:MAG TPA: hypothetical protein DCZ75_12040 [Geobacter sp.]|nr:hypothetical protein [Geobacter sp.]